jgi:hypothetical protein
MWGGAREGAGRPKGGLISRDTYAAMADDRDAIRRKIVGSEADPLLFLGSVVADPEASIPRRMKAAEVMLPFVFPKLHHVVQNQPAGAVKLTFNFNRNLPGSGPEIEAQAIEDAAAGCEEELETVALRAELASQDWTRAEVENV